MTILFFCRLFYPHRGGVETHVLKLSKVLQQKGFTIVVITEQYDITLQTAETWEGITIYRIPVGGNDWFKKFRIWGWLWNQRKLIEQARIVHAHDVFFWYLPFRFLYVSKPIFTTFHGYETIYPPAKKAIVVRKLSEVLSWGNVCVGDFIKKYYKTHPAYVTYGGVEIREKPQHRDAKEKLTILFVGRLEKDTGILIYLRALDVLKEERISFTFVVCGDGRLREQVEKYGNVYGFVENVQSYIDQADIIFSSSYLSILESIARKRLVFAIYDNPLKRDYLTMAPFAKWITVTSDPIHLAESIIVKTSNKERQKELDNAYAWVRQQTWDNLAKTYLKLWKL